MGHGRMSGNTLSESIENIGGHKFIKLKSGRLVGWTDANKEARDHLSSLARWLWRMSRLARDDEWSWEYFERLIDQVDALVMFYRGEIKKHSVRKQKSERIAALRNVTGRTPDEAAAFLAKADQLEKEL